MKLYNAIIAFSNSDGTVGVSLTSDLNNRLIKFNQLNHPIFKTFTTDAKSKEDIVAEFLQHEFFVNNVDFYDALKYKVRSKIVKTSVQDILHAVSSDVQQNVVA